MINFSTEADNIMNTHSAAPLISSVKDSEDNSIPRNGSALTSSLRFEGTAQALSTVSLFDGEAPLAPPVSVTAEGRWTLTLEGINSGAHNFTARTADAAPASSPWTVTVTEQTTVIGVEQWDTFPFGPLPVDQLIECGYGMTLTITGDGASITRNSVPESEDHALKPGENCHLRFDFGGSINRLYILHSGARALHNLFRFYDDQDNLVTSIALESPDQPTKITLVEIDPFCTYLDALFIGNQYNTLIDALVWEHRELIAARSVTADS
jgi:hypothetical protein